MFFLDDDDADLIRSFEAGLVLPEATIQQALDALGRRLVAWLQGYTGPLAPPFGARVVMRADGGVRVYVPPRGRASGPRPRHPGGWADDTGTLQRAYRFTVQREAPGVWALTLVNDAGYAGYLEGKAADPRLHGGNPDRYWVLGGVFEAADGLDTIERHLQAAFT